MYDELIEQASEQPSTPGEAIVEVDLDAAPSEVWHALTTDEGFASWIGEGSTIGREPGDDLYVHDIVTGKDKRGVLDEVTPDRRLGYTWWPETAPEQATRVAISLEPRRGGTRVTVVESRPLVVPAGAPTPLQAHAGANSSAWGWRAALLAVRVAAPVRRPLMFSAHQLVY